jgi:diacylglycerol kinase family enzyme
MTSPHTQAPTTLPPHHPTTQLRRVVILANPHAGASDPRGVVEELADALRLRGFEPATCWHRDEFTARVREDRPEDLRCVVSAGGDGTLVEVLNRAPGVPVAILPLGNENLVAGFWGVERSGLKLARIIAEGHTRRLDLGRANGRLFCLMASAGIDAEVVARVHRHRRGHINHFTYASPLWRALWTYRFPPIEVELPDTGEKLRGAMVFIFNLPRYALGLPIAPEARGDDGLLDVCVFERRGVFNLFRYLALVMGGWRDRLSDFHHRQVRHLRLRSEQPVHLQADGDPEGLLPADVEVVPGALNLLVPHP